MYSFANSVIVYPAKGEKDLLVCGHVTSISWIDTNLLTKGINVQKQFSSIRTHFYCYPSTCNSIIVSTIVNVKTSNLLLL